MPNLKSVQEQELELYKSWKKGNQDALVALMNSLKPIAYKAVTKWSGGSVPREVLEAQATKFIYQGLKTFDPKKGVKLSTHITNQLLPLSRIVYSYANVMRIPENRIGRLKLFEQKLDELTDKLGRRPTVEELAEELGWSMKMVEQTSRDLYKDIYLQDEMLHAPMTETSLMHGAIDFFYHSLPVKEKLIFEDLTGYGGRPRLSDSLILKAHNITQSELDQFKEKIKNELGTLISIKR